MPRSIARSLENRENSERRLKCDSSRHLAARDVDAVLAVILHVVHRLVGRLDEPFRRRRHVGERRHAHRDGQMDVEAVSLEKMAASMRSRMRSPTAAAPSLPVSGRISANSSPPKRATTSVSRALRRISPAASISARLPYRWPCVSLIALEAVEVDEQQRQRTAAARGALGFPAQDLRQIARVVELRQVVGDRQRFGARDAQRVFERDGARLERREQRRLGRRRERGLARRGPLSRPTSAADRPSPALEGEGEAAAAAPPPNR